MADRIQQRRDTAARWAQFNPILLEGEVGYVTDDPNQYKIGDGVHSWNELPLRGFDGTLVHTLGDSETAAASQFLASQAFYNSDYFDFVGNLSLLNKVHSYKGMNSFIPLFENNFTSSIKERIFFYTDNIMRYIRFRAFQYVYLYITEAGKFNVYKATGFRSSNVSYEVIKEFNITETGWQTLDLESVITLSEEEYIGFGYLENPSEAAAFGFLNINVGYDTYYGFRSNSDWGKQNLILNIGVGISGSNTIKLNSAFNGFPMGYFNSNYDNIVLDIDFHTEQIRIYSYVKTNNVNRDVHVGYRNSNGNFLHELLYGGNIADGFEKLPFLYSEIDAFPIQVILAFIPQYRQLMLVPYDKWNEVVIEYNNAVMVGSFRLMNAKNGNVAGNTYNLPSFPSEAIETTEDILPILLDYNLNFIDTNYTLIINGVNITKLKTEAKPFSYSELDGDIYVRQYGRNYPNNAHRYISELFASLYNLDFSGKYVKSVIYNANRPNGYVKIFAAKYTETNDDGVPNKYSDLRHIKTIHNEVVGLVRGDIDYQLSENEIILIYDVNASLSYGILENDKEKFFNLNSNPTVSSRSLSLCYLTYDDEAEANNCTGLSGGRFCNLTDIVNNGLITYRSQQYIFNPISVPTNIFPGDSNHIFFQMRRDFKDVGAYVKSVKMYLVYDGTKSNTIKFYSARIHVEDNKYINSLSDALCIYEYTFEESGYINIPIEHQLGPNRILGIQAENTLFQYINSNEEYSDTVYCSLRNGDYSSSVMGIYSGCLFAETFLPVKHTSGIFEGYLTRPVRLMSQISTQLTNANFNGFFVISPTIRNKRIKGIEFFSCNDKPNITIRILERTDGSVDYKLPSDSSILEEVELITLTGVKRGYNRIDFPNVIVLSNNQYISVGAAENLDYTNECTLGYIKDKDKEQADEVFDIFQFYSGALTEAGGNLYGLYTDYDDHEIYCPTEAEEKGGLGRMANKSISFIGDSITTFSGFIPTANAVYYPNAGITKVNQTYWMRCLGKMKMRLFTNEAWSGSRLTGTTASAAVSESRWNNLRSTGNTGEDPDYIVIHISTNDWTGNVELGDYDFTDDADKTKLKSAWCYLIRKLQQTYKKSQIYICTLLFRQQWTDHEYLHANSAGQTIQDYNEVIREVAKIFGLHLIELDRCGFNAFNFTNGQYPGSDNQYSNNDGLHPNYEGAKIVAEFMDEYLFNR